MLNIDCVIVGSGMAGMTAAIYLKRSNVDVCIIESDVPGGILNKINIIENYPGFDSITGPNLAYKVFDQVNKLKIPIKYNKVLEIDNNVIKTDKEQITAKKIIIATGRPPKRFKLLDGYHNVSYCAVCDGNLYKNKKVALIGENVKEELDYLSTICSEVIVVSNKDIKSVNSKDNIVYEIITDKIIPVDGVFVYLGYEPKTDFVKNIKLDNGYIVVDKNMQTSNPNIYACGDIVSKDIYQLTTATSDATIAAINVKKNLNL